MKIALRVTLDVDPETWSLIYGTGTNQQAIRDDVLTHLRNTVHEHYVTDLGIAVDSTVVPAHPPRMSHGLR